MGLSRRSFIKGIMSLAALATTCCQKKDPHMIELGDRKIFYYPEQSHLKIFNPKTGENYHIYNYGKTKVGDNFIDWVGTSTPTLTDINNPDSPKQNLHTHYDFHGRVEEYIHGSGKFKKTDNPELVKKVFEEADKIWNKYTPMFKFK